MLTRQSCSCRPTRQLGRPPTCNSPTAVDAQRERGKRDALNGSLERRLHRHAEVEVSSVTAFSVTTTGMSVTVAHATGCKRVVMYDGFRQW